MERTTGQRRLDERRRLWDRRAPLARRTSEDRRRGERRSEQSAADERRSGRDRRADERRATAERERRAEPPRRRRERRRTTPVPYGPEQVADLNARFAAGGPVQCPACGARFALGPGRRSGGRFERLVLCIGCGRGTVIEDATASRVLVISSVAPLRNLLRDMLFSAGHDVVEADDAAVGLDAYHAIPADLVIVDVLASGRVPAPVFVRKLREAFPDARVAALAGRSSYAGVDPLQLVEGLDGVRTVRVPVSRETLLRTVQELRG